MSKFNELGLSDKILEVLAQIGFETPTPIQEQAIPMLLGNDGTDFIGLAQTGTGKTAAYGLPLLDLIDENSPHSQALIMAPTRELGQQIAQQLVEFSRNQPRLNVEVVYGGASITAQMKALRKPVQIVVATPGRLLDLIGRKAVQLDNIGYVILDEADEMLNMGFKEDIDAILEHTGDARAIWLFSATMPNSIRQIVRKYMDDPMEVAVNSEEITNPDITHQYVVTQQANKLMALRRFMDIQPEMRGVLFCRTKRETQEIAEQLGSLGYSVAALNGDMSQDQRDKVMKLFRTSSMQLLIATDVAARGIDVKDLSYVIHYNLPDQIEYYTHRSGRTGRAGNQGISLAFVHPREMRKITALERRINIQFEQVKVPSHQQVVSGRLNHWADSVTSAKVHSKAASLLGGLQEQFAHLSKEELLERLISAQLDRLMLEEGSDGDLNETVTDKRADRKSASKTFETAAQDQSGTHRYFINVGMMDGVNQTDLVYFLSDVTGVKRKHFGGFALKKNCTYFDVDVRHDQGLGDKFRGIEIDGRPIRVNREMGFDHPKRDRKKFQARKGTPSGGSKYSGKNGGHFAKAKSKTGGK